MAIAEQPIILVGPSRSGTSMMRSLLNNHSQVHLAGETHYFDDLRPRLGDGTTPLDVDQRQVCEDYFLAIAHRPYGHQGDPSASPLDRMRLRETAAALGGDGDAYLRAFCRIEAADAGKQRWGEKTPRHVFRIPDILDRYPQGRVLCMMRDPRAVVASYRDWRYQGGFDLEADPGHEAALEAEQRRSSASYHVIVNTMLWRAAANAATAARARFGAERVRVLRYEDVVRDPRTSAEAVADWLALPFEEAMLDVPVHNSSFAAFDLAGGFSKEALDRWRRTLGPDEVAVIERVAGRAMAAHAYEPEAPPASLALMARHWATVPAHVGRATLLNRSRIAQLPSYVWRRARLAAAGGR